MLSAKQKKIASKAGDPNKIDAKDFAVLKAEKAKGRGMGLQDEQLPPGKMENAKHGKMIKKAKDMSKLHENKETTMQEGKETMMESKGYEESSSGKMSKKMGGGMIEPTMSNYQKKFKEGVYGVEVKGGSVMARGSKLAKVRPTKLY
jgi:hypothetical protein